MNTQTVGYNNKGQAKAKPENANELAYSIFCNACKRYLEGKIGEHDAYRFYSGSQIKVFITEVQYNLLKKLSENGYCDELIVNGKDLGEWSIHYLHGRWSCMLILTLSKEFINKHAIIKRFAQLAVVPIAKDATWKECEGGCGCPMVHPIDDIYLCHDCYKRLHPEDCGLIF